MNIEFIEIDDKEFIEEEIDVSEMTSKEEIIEKINEMSFEEDKYWKIIFIGNRNFEINTREILKYVTHQNVIKIKDKTELKINVEQIAMQNNLKGIFVKNLLQKIKDNPEDKEKLEKALEIGLLYFEK